jgi:dihydrodipicolinate synthase/N-acetylneuraminate lyase
MARDAKAEGVDGIFFMPPLGVNDITSSWNPERYPDVWIDMAQAIEDAVDLPMVVHPVSGVMHPIFGMGLPLLAARKMWEQIPHVVGWKMTYSYEGYRIIAKALQEFPRHIAVLGAGATRFHENLAMRQLDGTVTGSHNFSMELIVDHLQAWQACNLEQACQIWFDGGLCSLQEYVYSDGSRLHVRYKAACWLRGLIPEPFMRRPMPKPMVEEVHELRTLLRGAGYEVISDSAVKRLYPDIW